MRRSFGLCPWRGAGVAEQGCLLSSYTGMTGIEGSNPSLSATCLLFSTTHKETQMRNIGFALILALLIVPKCLWAQKPGGGVRTVPVEGPVYMLEGGGGNIGVITTPSGPIVIDAMMAGNGGQIKTALRAIGGDNIRYLINTHWHNDHTDGNKALGPGTIIVAQQNVRTLLEKPSELMGQKPAPPMPEDALPQITFSDRLTLHAGDVEIRLVHYPNSHSNGDTVVYIDRFKVVHMGDMFFNGLFPFLDVDNGGDIENWVRNLDIVLAGIPGDTKIIPGHGPLTDPAGLKAFRDMLADAASLVKERIAAGKNLDEIKAEGLPERFEPWMKGFLPAPQWLELVYRSLTKK